MTATAGPVVSGSAAGVTEASGVEGDGPGIDSSHRPWWYDGRPCDGRASRPPARRVGAPCRDAKASSSSRISASRDAAVGSVGSSLAKWYGPGSAKLRRSGGPTAVARAVAPPRPSGTAQPCIVPHRPWCRTGVTRCGTPRWWTDRLTRTRLMTAGRFAPARAGPTRPKVAWTCLPSCRCGPRHRPRISRRPRRSSGRQRRDRRRRSRRSRPEVTADRAGGNHGGPDEEPVDRRFPSSGSALTSLRCRGGWAASSTTGSRRANSWASVDGNRSRPGSRLHGSRSPSRSRLTGRAISFRPFARPSACVRSCAAGASGTTGARPAGRSGWGWGCGGAASIDVVCRRPTAGWPARRCASAGHRGR